MICSKQQIFVEFLCRKDEKFVTEAAYKNAKFVEDIARDIAVALQKDKAVTGFSVAVDNMESIHSHNAYAFYCSEEIISTHRK